MTNTRFLIDIVYYPHHKGSGMQAVHVPQKSDVTVIWNRHEHDGKKAGALPNCFLPFLESSDLVRLGACCRYLRDTAFIDDVWRPRCEALGWSGFPRGTSWQAGFSLRRRSLCVECGHPSRYVFALLGCRLCERCEHRVGRGAAVRRCSMVMMTTSAAVLEMEMEMVRRWSPLVGKMSLAGRSAKVLKACCCWYSWCVCEMGSAGLHGKFDYESDDGVYDGGGGGQGGSGSGSNETDGGQSNQVAGGERRAEEKAARKAAKKAAKEAQRLKRQLRNTSARGGAGGGRRSPGSAVQSPFPPCGKTGAGAPVVVGSALGRSGAGGQQPPERPPPQLPQRHQQQQQQQQRPTGLVGGKGKGEGEGAVGQPARGRRRGEAAAAQAKGCSPTSTCRTARPLLVVQDDGDGEGSGLPLEGQAVALPRSSGGRGGARGGGGGGGGGTSHAGGGGGHTSSRVTKLKSGWAAEREALMAAWGQYGISGLVLAS
ncbi:hypothetical protein VOLCADRAFT_98468 [Volvox carteri f. nagariensis]|uniref:F-box domain-containing protein n=1 Tax=Volvox carteri f. nagariensis TaxID=3068 RepID=D8UFE9_VOLCA|nr:uncharacterized protein VOLCADRAFT_98468 [Volvox carteri f. nagariensis]EFJ41558.1 hypothetical protein VOLCADRAFT_98468 [Volvox carteri f. nagariensis]|eukprot:XP_002957349.1 hypothetical protein VOLCADRAFT_98468 [Volvox carteri f. nagariensis]